MDPITAVKAFFALDNLKKKASALFKSPWFYVALAVLALGIGTYAYLNHSTHEAVKTAVANSNQNATIKTYKTKDEAESRLIPVQEKEQAKAEQTQKDYANVRTVIVTAPIQDRQAQTPRVIIDTLNDLDRLSGERDAGSVPQSDVHPKRTRL